MTSDQQQTILTLYLTALHIQKVAHPTREQFSTGQTAARNLIEFVPAYFTPNNRPPGTTPADWTKAQNDIENTAHATLAALTRRPPSVH